MNKEKEEKKEVERIKYLQNGEINGEPNGFYENRSRHNTKHWWFDLLVEGKETISFGFTSYEIFKIQPYIVEFYVSMEKKQIKDELQMLICFNRFLGDNIYKFKDLLFGQVPHKDEQKNWINPNKCFDFYSDLDQEFEILALIEEKSFIILQDAYNLYINKAKKKITTTTKKIKT